MTRILSRNPKNTVLTVPNTDSSQSESRVRTIVGKQTEESEENKQSERNRVVARAAVLGRRRGSPRRGRRRRPSLVLIRRRGPRTERYRSLASPLTPVN
jgi:hypothetical protein